MKKVLAIGLLILGFVFANSQGLLAEEQNQKSQSVRKFEYKVAGAFLNEGGLNDLGKEGWELVSVDGGMKYLKREIQK